MQYHKVGVENSAKPCHIPCKMVRNCAKTNVPATSIALLIIPQLYRIIVQIQSSKGLESKIQEIVTHTLIIDEDLAQAASLDEWLEDHE